jgi:hypothetical protein
LIYRIIFDLKSYLAAGIYVGSCDYADLCSLIKTLIPDSFNPTFCSQFPALLDIGIDCNCPFNVKSGFVNLQDIVLLIPDASQSIATFLASGDFDVTANVADPVGPIANIQILFSAKPAGSG